MNKSSINKQYNLIKEYKKYISTATTFISFEEFVKTVKDSTTTVTQKPKVRGTEITMTIFDEWTHK